MGILRRRREGFSLIELLIVVAIIAALVGVAVPFFQDNLSEAQRTKAGQDLEVIKKAIALYDAREPRPLTGTDLSPLLGRYMQEMPEDPWGNQYLFDGGAGMLASYGADSLAGGTGGDTDITVYTRPPVQLNRAQYQGSWGRRLLGVDLTNAPNINWAKGNRLILTFTKPITLTGGSAGLPDQVNLLRQIGPAPLPANADPLLFSDANLDFVPGDDPGTSGGHDPLHRPELGVVTLFRDDNTLSGPSDGQAITPTMAIDLTSDDFGEANPVNPPGVGALSATINESFYLDATPTSPLDTTVYGQEATDYQRKPNPSELVNGIRRGIKIEKY